MTDSRAVAGGTVVTMNPERQILRDGVVVVEGNLITAVGSREDVAIPAGAEVIDATGSIVIPGLVNSHTHGCMTFQRTIGYDQQFDDWFARTQVPMMAAMSLDDFRLAERLMVAENLLEGNTTIVENSFFPASVRREGDPEEVVVEEARRLGARLVLATAFLTDHTDARFVEPQASVMARMESALHRWHRRERVVVTPSLLLPWATSPRTLRSVAELARGANAMLHLHTAETPFYDERCRTVHGFRSNVAMLDDCAALGPDVQLVGCSEIDEADIDLVAASGSRVISVPTSDLFQSHRPAPVVELRRRGVAVSLGANGCAGNGRQSMFEAMKDGAGLAKALHQDPTALGKDDVLTMATIGAAQNLGIDDLVGSIEIGKRADLVVVESRVPHATPLLNVVAGLVYSLRGTDVRDVLVDGDVVVRGRRLVRGDADDIAKAVQERAEKVAADVPEIEAFLGG